MDRTEVGAVRAGVMGLLLVVMAAPGAAAAGVEIPHFARKYGLECGACHVQPPMLNERGEAFRRNGYQLPGVRARRTIPLAVWASARSDAFPNEAAVRDAVRAYINKLELISGGQVVAPWLSYFVEWRPVSLETVRRDGVVGLRDRSGRFEDLFLSAAVDRLTVTVGQFRQMDQVDVSLRLGLSEPLSLAASLGGSGGGSARQRSLRGFSPSGRSPSARASWLQPLSGSWSWTTSAALPIAGEFSIPLTREARVEASHEVEWRLKGVFVESFLERGPLSIGGHAFYDHSDRYLVQGVTTARAGQTFWTAVAGMERQADRARARWSVEGVYAPRPFAAFGGRAEDRGGDGAPPALVPYARVHFPGTRYTVYLGVEQRLQRQRNATLLEFGTVF